MQADYIIRGGQVIDPETGICSERDIVVQGAHIVAPTSEPVRCDHIIDATGMLVTPGWIDFHTHLFHTGSSFGIRPDLMIAQGTTAAVDAGTAGIVNYEAFHKTVVESALVRVKSFVTVYSGGQLDPLLCEDFDPQLYNVEKAARVLDKYRDNILGFKIRFSRGVVPDGTGSAYLEALIRLAEEMERRLDTHLRICVHTTNAPIPAGEIAALLRPGDIFAHCYQGAGNGIVLPNGSIDPRVLEARERGVLFDAANGKGNFCNEIAQKAIAAGFLPDIISSDLTADKFNLPPHAKNLPQVVSKYLTLGMRLPDILPCITTRPAAVMGLAGKIGSLLPGAYADIAIFQQRTVRYAHQDFRGAVLPADTILVPQLTMCGGEIQYSQADFYL